MKKTKNPRTLLLATLMGVWGGALLVTLGSPLCGDTAELRGDGGALLQEVRDQQTALLDNQVRLLESQRNLLEVQNRLISLHEEACLDEYAQGWDDAEHASGCDPSWDEIPLEDLKLVCSELETFGYVPSC